MQWVQSNPSTERRGWEDKKADTGIGPASLTAQGSEPTKPLVKPISAHFANICMQSLHKIKF